MINVLLFGVSIMDEVAYQALRFAEYLKRWEIVDDSLEEYFVQYKQKSIRGRLWILTLTDSTVEIKLHESKFSNEISFEDCSDPTTWVSRQIVNFPKHC
jgi:hypothetical protein